ncbi:hypothetical protein K9M48_01755 [Candidatus Gracilibacteria bacterium]|nr:hypothetical protein [Candidatus Gracilibacteria bacterium]
MKKHIITLILFVLSFISFTNAQNISNISASFCDELESSNSLNITTDSAKINEICVKFINNSDKNITINVGFPDSEITNDSFKIRACKSERKIENFGQYINNPPEYVSIPSNGEITKKFYLKYPAGYEGISRGCMTYFLNNIDSDNMINVVVRKKLFIEALVGSNFQRNIEIQEAGENKFFSSNSKIKIEKEEINGGLIASFSIQNSGDIDEVFNGTGLIKNNYGVHREILFENIEIKSNSIKEVEVTLKEIPFYKGSYLIQIDGEIKPEILFNKDKIKSELKTPIKINEKTKIFIIPRNIIIGIIIFLLIIFLIKRKN